MQITAIAAMSLNRVIGKDNQIPWYLPADLRFFMQTTVGHHVLMGRKNYLSMGKPLPRRTNIVITRNPFFVSSGCLVVHSLEEALALAHERDEQEAFIIGGGEIYRLSMDYLDKIYLTTIDLRVGGDVFFPEIDPEAWRVVDVKRYEADEKNADAFKIETYERNPLTS
jgi:dihydrofolate reductase